jgi:hypothetical protein
MIQRFSWDLTEFLKPVYIVKGDVIPVYLSQTWIGSCLIERSGRMIVGNFRLFEEIGSGAKLEFMLSAPESAVNIIFLNGIEFVRSTEGANRQLIPVSAMRSPFS